MTVGVRRIPGPGLAPVRSPRLICVILSLSAFVVSLTQTLVVPVLPTLPAKLGTSASTASWLVTITVVAAAVANPILGRLGDQFGLRLMFLYAMSAFLAGSLVCALTSRIELLIAGRALQGVAIASIPLGISLIAELVPPELRPGGIAMVSAMLGIGGAIGLPVAGLISQTWNFHALFWIAAAAGLPAFVAVWRLVPEPPRVSVRVPVDLAGGALLVATLTALLLPLSRGSQWGWTSPRTLGLLAAAAVGMAGFVALELRRTAPMVDIRLARRRPLVLTNTASVLVGFGLFASFLGTNAVLQAPKWTGYGFGLSVLVAGLWQLPVGLVMAGLSPVTARIIGRRSPRTAMLLGTALLCVGFVLRVFLDAELWEIVGCATVISAGTAVSYAAMPALVMAAAPPEHRAASNGLNALARTLGTSLSSAAFGALTVGTAATAMPTASAYTLFFAVAATTSLLALIATAFLR